MAENIQFPCAACARWVELASSLAGRAASCPECGEGVRVPMRGLAPVEVEVGGGAIEKVEVAIARAAPEGIRELTLRPFLEWVATRARTERFEDGHTLQMGWTLLQCRVDRGVLRLLAPDMRSMPIEFTSDLTGAVWALFQHREVPASFDPGLSSLDIPSLRHSAVVGPRFAETPCLMERSAPNAPTDSGWTFNSMRPDVDDNDRDGLSLMSLYQVVLESPIFLRYLSLPVGFSVRFSADAPAPRHYRDGRPIDPVEGSYLAQALEVEAG